MRTRMTAHRSKPVEWLGVVKVAVAAAVIIVVSARGPFRWDQMVRAAGATLLRKAFRKRQKTAPSPAPQQLELDGGATPKPKPSKPVLHSALAGLRQVRPEDLPCSGDKRKDLKRKGLAAATMATKEAAKIAAAGVEKAAKNAASAASAAAQGSGAGDDGDDDSDDKQPRSGRIFDEEAEAPRRAQLCDEEKVREPQHGAQVV